MTKLSMKIHHTQLFDLLRHKNAADQVSMGLRVSRRSEGEGAETLMFRSLAEQSLKVPGQQRI